MNKCVICEIVSGDQKSFIVYENSLFISFLDINPLFPGHCLLSPKEHLATFYDLDNAKVQIYSQLIQKIGKAIEISMESQGSFIAINNIVSQSIPHLHTHIVPRNLKDGLKGFFWPRNNYQNEEHMHEIQIRINTQIKKLIPF